jgi:hypothetical protein
MTTRRWQLSDLLDLERELELDRRDGRAATPAGNPRAAASDLLYDWMLARRDLSPDVVSFGRRFQTSESLLRWVGIVLSFLAGLGLTAALLRYSGEALINVMAFLAVAVGLQLLGLLFSAAAMALNRFRPRAGGWLLRITRIDQLSRQLTLSADPLRWRAFGLLQAWGVALNLGILITLLYKVVFFDLSFGWATTLDVSSAQIHALLVGLSFPWRGIFSGAIPSLQEVELSRIVLAQGTVGTGAASWWKFLFAAVFTYGLLPRLTLWIVAAGLVRRKLARLSFETAACQSLLLRLRQPVSRDWESDTRPASTVPSTPPAPPPPGGRYRVQLPAGWTTPADPGRLRDGFGVDAAVDGPESRLLRLVESWRPPLEQDLVDLREIVEGLPRDGVLLLGMLGLADDEALTAPEDQDMAIWSEFVRRRLTDPRVAVIAFREPTP